MPGQALTHHRVSVLALFFVWMSLCATGCASSRGPSVLPERTLLSHKLAGVDDFGTLLVDAGLPTDDLPQDEALSPVQVRELQLRLDLERPKSSEEAPWVVAHFVLNEVSAQKKASVTKTELSHRLRVFENLYVLRRDGYFAHALSGRAVQCVGPVEVRDGALRAGAFEVEHFYKRDAQQHWQLASLVAVAPAR
jgi:hypothetical protein